MSEKVINKDTLWEKNSDWLRDSRKNLWNPEYFELLVKQVWKIDKPVKIVDFGCGIGYLGSVLLPLLPKGSTYTGLDISGMLLEEARMIFAGAEWQTEFMEQDLTQYIPEEKYDIAICQTFLIHIPYPLKILEKMVKSVVQGGRVICMEPNWVFNYTGNYRHGREGYLDRDWRFRDDFINELKENGIDRCIGIKIPAFMYDLGLKNVDIRISDKAVVSFDDNFNTLIEYYANNGLVPNSTPEIYRESEQYIKNNLFEGNYKNNKSPFPSIGIGLGLLISYGEK